jgi:hypothetical protein
MFDETQVTAIDPNTPRWQRPALRPHPTWMPMAFTVVSVPLVMLALNVGAGEPFGYITGLILAASVAVGFSAYLAVVAFTGGFSDRKAWVSHHLLGDDRRTRRELARLLTARQVVRNEARGPLGDRITDATLAAVESAVYAQARLACEVDELNDRLDAVTGSGERAETLRDRLSAVATSRCDTMETLADAVVEVSEAASEARAAHVLLTASGLDRVEPVDDLPAVDWAVSAELVDAAERLSAYAAAARELVSTSDVEAEVAAAADAAATQPAVPATATA